jgi:GAF domain-containing protein
MSNRRTPLRFAPSAQTAAIALSVLAVLGCTAVAVLVPAPPLSPFIYLTWTITLAAALNLNIRVELIDVNFSNFFLLAGLLALGMGPTLVIFLSALLLSEAAGLFWRRYTDRSDHPRMALVSIANSLAADGCALLAGGAVFYALGGDVPFIPVSTAWNIDLSPVLLQLAGLDLAFLLVNFGVAIVLLKLAGTEVQSFADRHQREILMLGIVPAVLSVTLAIAALSMPGMVFAVACLLLVFSMFMTHSLSNARARLERRVRELGSLAAIGQTVANSLELPEVLEAIHQQTQHLMDAHNFYIALYDDGERRINFPLAYENNQRVIYTSRLFGDGFTEYIILSRQPLLIKHDVQAFARQLGQTVIDVQVRSWLGVPIAVGERVLGVIAVQSRERANSYDESHRDILTSIATQAATAIRNSQMYMAVRRQTANLSVINSVLTAINSTLDLNQVLDIIVNSVPQVVGCQQAAIFLADDQGRSAQLAASYNFSPEYVAQSQVLPISSIDRSVVMVTGQPLIVHDTHDDEAAAFRAIGETEGFRAFAAIPLQTSARPIGSLAVYYAEPHQFAPDEIDELTTFANQAAVAVANARLYAHTDQALAKRMNQLAMLEQIGRDLTSSLDLDQILRRLLDRAVAATGAAQGNVGLWNAEQRLTQVMVTSGLSAEGELQIKLATWPVTLGLTGRAIRTGQSVYVTDVRHDSDYFAANPQTRSEMVVLIKKEERILGIINLESPEVGRFDQAALDFVGQLARQAAIALDNAQLFRQAQSRLHEVSILYTVGQQLTSLLDLSQLGEELTRQMARALNTTYCALQIYDLDTDRIHSVARYFSPDLAHTAATLTIPEEYRLTDHPGRQAAFAQHTFHIAYRTDSAGESGDWEFLRRHDLHATLTVPLILREEISGAVEWADERPDRRFTHTEERLAVTLANQATIAVHNARLFEERTRRISTLDQLYQASLALSASIELEDVLKRIGTVACEICRADAASLYLYDQQTESFTRAYAVGVTGDWSPSHLRSTGMTRRVMKEGAPVLVTETHGHPEVNPHTVEAGVRSLIATPLISQGNPVGVMYVGSFSPHQFDASDVQIVSALANQAAVVIANARLFSEVAESRDRLQAILDSADDSILMFDMNLQISMLNPNLETLCQVPRSALVGHSLLNLLTRPELALAEKLGYTTDRLRQLLLQLRERQEAAWGKNVYVLPGSSPARYIERVCLPVRAAAPHPIGWMMVLRDVTEEIELQRMRDDLSHTIVHDLRTPLSSILGGLYFLEELTEDSAASSPEREALSISIRSANKLLNLVNSLLDIARLSAGQTLVEVQAQRLEPVLDAAFESLLPLAEDSGITITRDIQSDLPLVLIDEDKVNRVLINLIDNALKFTPRGGRVAVVAERWRSSGESSYVRCSVRDTGPGIPPEYRTRIFDRFVQLANRRGRRRGTGIGLNFCRLAVEAHGGKIWIEDTPDGGSDFSFTLPALPE